MTRAVMVFSTDVLAELEDEFNRWYDRVHIPSRMSVPGFVNVKRFRAADDVSPRYLTIYELTGPEILDSEAYRAAAEPSSEDETMRRAMISPRRWLMLEMDSRQGDHDAASADL